jgi:hypothetical protein
MGVKNSLAQFGITMAHGVIVANMMAVNGGSIKNVHHCQKEHLNN